MCVPESVSVCVCSGMHFLNNGNLDYVPNLKKLMAMKLGPRHGSKFPIPLIENTQNPLQRLSLPL